MAKNDVVITLRIDDAGNIKQVGNKAKKAAKDVDKLGKSAASTDRHMKGVSQQSSNASKNFSKMAQGMQGGLVPAYATLAAQIFAVTALFRFLQQAADYRVLIAGQKAFAAETGIAYNSIARSLQDATEGQLAFKDASQAAAIGSAAGLSPDQLTRLSVAAKNTSIALGRDLTDSFNRLIRGTTKAEPELLDELGIILRLDEATKNYAAQIGKTKDTLTIFEKSQAVTNEVLKQAEDKFGAIGNEVPVNALNQFAKAFDDVINALYDFIGPVAEGLAKFFANNLPAFIGALGVFAIPIIKMILPAFDEMGDRALLTAKKHRDAMDSQRADLQAYQAQFAQSRDKTGFAKQEFTSQAKKMGVSTSGRGKATAIAHFEKQTTQLMRGEITKRTGILANATKKEVALLKSKYVTMQGSASKFTMFFKRQMTTVTSTVAMASTKIKVIWSGTMAFMSRAAAKAGKFINRAFSVLMVISVLVMLFDLVKPYLDKYLGTSFTKEEDPLMESVRGAKDLNKELSRMAEKFKQKVGGKGSLADTLATANFGGRMTTSANLEARLSEYKGSTGEARKGLYAGLLQTIDSLGVVNIGFETLAGTMRQSGEITDATAAKMMKLAAGMMNAAQASQQLKTAQGELFKLNNSFLQNMGKLKFSGMIQQSRLAEEGAIQLMGENMREGSGLRRKGFSNLSDEQRKRFYEIYGAGADQITGKGGKGGSINTLAGVSERMGANKDFFLAQSTSAAAQTQAKTRIDMEMGSIRRSGQSAQFAKKELQIKKNLADIELARLNIKIAERVEAEGNPEQKEAAKLAIEQEMLNIAAIKEKNANIKDTMNHLSNLKVAAVDALETGMGNAIVGVLDGTKSMKEGFQDMAKAVLQAIAQIIAQMLAMKAIKAMSFGFADGGVIPMANGGIKPKGYRSGGVVTEPTYLVGEGKYNEAVVPLPDGRSIPVMMKGSGGGTANVTVNIAADGQASSNLTANNGQQAANLAKAVSAAVQEEMHKQQRPGGILSPYGGGTGG